MNGSTNTLEEVCQRKGILGLSAFEEYSRKLNLKSFFVAAIIMYFVSYAIFNCIVIREFAIKR
jgi:hypothetical protein